MFALDLTIETDKHGDHVVFFSGRREELIPPRDYDEKLHWIKRSFESFLAQVNDLEAVRRAGRVN